MRRGLLVVVVAIVGCGGEGPAPDAAPPPREVSGDVTVDPTGFSEELEFDVPPGTRSISIVVTGGETALYALGGLRFAGGVDLVGIALDTPPGPEMRSSYDTEQIGQMPGGLYQSMRLGTFTQVYPYRPDQTVTPGSAAVRVASDMPGPAHVSIYMPPDDQSHTLHVNLIAVSDTFTFPDPLTFVDEIQQLFDQVGITVAVDDVIALPGTGLGSITDFNEPQETPQSMSAMLPGLVADQVAPAGLDIFVVDSLPVGVGGLSLGTPGPPRRGSYYYGVLIRRSTSDAGFARVFAHEVCHFLALQHVTNVGISGTVYPDPLDDTAPGQGNLMESGTVLTADQRFALERSALLAPQ